MNLHPLLYLSLTLLFSSVSGFAATYFVDFEAGDNAAAGLSAETTWKHSPGDRNASDQPADHELQPGDIIRFKGGVQYHGEIKVEAAGAEGQPIIFDGNTDGTFGQGRAIFDGARVITDWQRVGSADEVQGNPRWKEIFYVDLDFDLSSNFAQDGFVLHRDKSPTRQAPWQRLFIVDDERSVLPIAQRPKPSDPFFPDLPEDFYKSPVPLASSYPHKVYYEEGSKGNRQLPLIALTYGGAAPVIEPFNGGAVSVEMNAAETISEIGFTLFRPKTTPVPEVIAFLADGQEIYVARVDPEDTKMQRFSLPQAVNARKLTFQLRHSDSDLPTWTKLQQIAAFNANGDNVIQHEISTIIVDEERMTQEDPNWYDGMFVGVHGGNNHVYFARVKAYDPATQQLKVPFFSATTYNKTSYALFNSPKFIDLPGEWCVVPLGDGRSRVFLLPEHLNDGLPLDIGYPVLETAISLDGSVAHVEVLGFIMQRYSGGKGGVATNAKGNLRPSHIRIADCEIRFMSAQSGISINHSNHIEIDNCYIHHCPGWTVGIYINRVNNYRITNTRLDRNSGSGIRHYEAKHGVLQNNVLINHYGMHSSGLNFYEGCADILFENNYVENVIAINRNAENLVFRNNVVNSQHRNAVSIAMWSSGSVGGRDIRNVLFENNTFVNVDTGVNWGTAIFAQTGASRAEGLVIRNNILDRLRPPVPATIENNIFMRETPDDVAGSGGLMVTDPNELFIDPAKGDFRRKPGGPMRAAGASVPPPQIP